MLANLKAEAALVRPGCTHRLTARSKIAVAPSGRLQPADPKAPAHVVFGPGIDRQPPPACLVNAGNGSPFWGAQVILRQRHPSSVGR